jgi:hypothetical protein
MTKVMMHVHEETYGPFDGTMETNEISAFVGDSCNVAGYYQFLDGRLAEISEQEYEACFKKAPLKHPRTHRSKRRREWA